MVEDGNWGYFPFPHSREQKKLLNALKAALYLFFTTDHILASSTSRIQIDIT